MLLPTNLDLKYFSLPLDVPSGVNITTVGTAASTIYSYRISSISNKGETLASSTISISTGNGTLNSTNFNRIKWDNAPGAVSYNIYGRTLGSELFIANVATELYEDKGAIVTPAGALPPTEGSGSNTIETTSFNLKSDINNSPVQPLTTPSGMVVVAQGTTAGQAYSYRVSARSGSGETLASTSVAIANGNPILSIANFNRITWKALPGAQQYNLYGRTAGSEKLLVTLENGVISFDDTGLKSPTKEVPIRNNTGVVTAEHNPVGLSSKIVITAINSTLYTITINGIAVTTTSDISATPNEIAVALKAAFDSNTDFLGKISMTLSTNDLVIIALNKNVTYTITVGANLVLTTTTIKSSLGLSAQNSIDFNRYSNRELIRGDDEGQDLVLRSQRQPIVSV